ncbi:Phage protein D [Candidatus Hepatincolaceae symbiont of Richtersius coronifer]
MKLYINDQFSELASNRILSFKLIDNMGLSLDSLEITINNSDKAIAIPKENAILELALKDVHNAEAEYKMGKFIAQYIDATSNIIKIQAISQDLSTARIRHNRVFKNKSLKEILQTLAADLDLRLQIDTTLSSNIINYYLQEEKTSLEILGELAEIYGAIANIKDNNLIFILKENVKKLEIAENTILSINKVDSLNKVYKGVQYKQWNFKTGQPEITCLGEEPFFVLKFKVDSSLENLYVNNAFKDRKVSEYINITLHGNANIQAGFCIEIGAIYPDFTGKYLIEKVIHKYSSSYTSNILAVKII